MSGAAGTGPLDAFVLETFRAARLNWYLAYAKAGKEFEVALDVENLGANCWCAKRVDFRRSGNNRRPEAITTPYIPNYIFIEMTDEQFISVQAVKHLASTFKAMHRGDVAGMNKFRRAVNKELAQAENVVKNQTSIEEYKAGQSICVLGGPFLDTVITYKRTIERAHDLHPKIVGEVDLMGRKATVEFDPIQVRAAT